MGFKNLFPSAPQISFWDASSDHGTALKQTHYAVVCCSAIQTELQGFCMGVPDRKLVKIKQSEIPI
jgi:hypothetical protein